MTEAKAVNILWLKIQRAHYKVMAATTVRAFAKAQRKWIEVVDKSFAEYKKWKEQSK
jgi:hypothetical protein